MYDYMDQSNDDKLSEATMQELLRQSSSAEESNDKKEQELPTFDDFALRERLLQEDDVFYVELDNIRVFHTSVCVMGLQAEYRVESSQSTVRLQKGECHYFAKGIFRFHCGATASQQDIVALKVTRKESIIKVRPTRGGIKGKALTVSHLLPNQTVTLN